MDFSENEEQRLIRESVRKLCSEFPDGYWEEHDREGKFPDSFFSKMAAAGWIGIAMPEQYGGAGKGMQEASIVLEEVAASGAAMNGATPLHLSIFGMHPVVKYGSEEMREKYLPPVARGEMHVAFGVTEPNAGSDTTAIETFARLDNEHYVVRGRKVWTSKAMESERVLLLVRTAPKDQVARKTDGMTLLLAELQKPEVSISPIAKLGRNAVRTCEVVYDDLKVSVSDRVGEEGEGFRYLLDGLNAERILIAAEALGIGRAAIRRAVNYANERIVFGRPIGKNQGIAFPLAEAQTQLDAAELMIRKAAWLLDNDMPCGKEANMAKWLAAEAGFRAADCAIQTHGGFGYAREYHVERYWREARLMKLAPISQEMILNFVSEHVLGLPRSY
ncbi:MAG: acyl-CoA dehydrogenase family protein [Gammaproteobacteria bacterium]|jgi:acyl-CoA dehydrogenase|nr:acyl-CoA dehydrogenase [Gammaproteobacteria bacterium]MDP6095905.1 acyl-CoA dehydrogenase family protein [Gammaproteobacteria bacterium]MDP7454968.1 acyl-CoA dehydrogenase family protein [Gammaproteobacteria bacterium]HJO12097.1 acyl-CoA dehydrogenase family protein [Gammaproteobacteria bacterium]|tara:strand:- start:392 stop:1558 length:1167 start_codon:yes stop_codon:yes gene_type:complete